MTGTDHRGGHRDDGLDPGGDPLRPRRRLLRKIADSIAVALNLQRGELVDTPGIGGANLSPQPQLTVNDVSEPGAPQTIYSGPLASMPEQDAGELAPGGSRTYEFVATLPDGAPSEQNALQKASTRRRWRHRRWHRNARHAGSRRRDRWWRGPGRRRRARPDRAEDRRHADRRRPRHLHRLRRLLRIFVRGKLRATAHGHHRKAKLRFIAIGTAEGRDAVKKKVRLRVRHH